MSLSRFAPSFSTKAIFPRPLKFTRPLAANTSADRTDVRDAKTLLAGLGFYAPPDWGVTGYPDRALFDAIRGYQKSQGLSVDGVIKPGGETEASLRALQESAGRGGVGASPIESADAIHAVNGHPAKTMEYSGTRPLIEGAPSFGEKGRAGVLNLAGRKDGRAPATGGNLVRRAGITSPSPSERKKIAPPLDPSDSLSADTTPAYPVPANKKNWMARHHQEKNWNAFHEVTSADKGLGERVQYTFQEIFGQEGAMTSRANGTTAGMQPGTLNGLIKGGYVKNIPLNTSPRDLSLEQMRDAYKGFFDETFKALGGVKALNRIHDKRAAAVLGDALFSHGTALGTLAVQKGINAVRPGLLGTPDRIPGSKTLQALDALTADPKTRDATLNAIADARWEVVKSDPNYLKTGKKGWRDRIDYYRP